VGHGCVAVGYRRQSHRGPGGAIGKSVIAYNKNTGASVWKVLNDTQAYVSPMLVELNGRRQIMVVSSSRVVGLVPENVTY
jgi:outer membrane protein assembly factor BamB